jgi:hypothetical protein
MSTTKPPNVLLDFYYNEEKENLLYAILDIIESGGDVPFDDVCVILENSDDIEIIGLCMELIYLNHVSLSKLIFKRFDATESEQLRLWLMVVLCIQPSDLSMQFIIHSYITYESLRPHIAKTAFKNKLKLVMGLSRFVESRVLSEDEESYVMDLLMTIPRSTILRIGQNIGKLRIMDVYYKIPPSKRRQD